MNERNLVMMRLWILREKIRLGYAEPGLTPELDGAYHAALRQMQTLQHEKATILCAGAHCTGGAGGGAVTLKAWNGLDTRPRKCAVCMAAELLELRAAGALGQ